MNYVKRQKCYRCNVIETQQKSSYGHKMHKEVHTTERALSSNIHKLRKRQ